MGAADGHFIRQKASLVGSYGDCGLVESVARVSTRTEHHVAHDRGRAFVDRLLSRKHMSPFEFVWLDFHITTSRAIANELVRHRIASYCQESTRYVDLRNSPKFILPSSLQGDGGVVERLRDIYMDHCMGCVRTYTDLIDGGASRETARDVLPLGLATRIRAGMNMRAFRGFLKQRLAPAAAEDMRVLAALMYDEVAFHHNGLLPMVIDFRNEAEAVICPE